MMKQSLITDHFDPSREYLRDHIVINKDGDDSYYAELPDRAGKHFGELGILEDGDGCWLNFIDVDKNYQKLGIGTKLMLQAIADYGEILASDAPRDEDDDDDGDTRHVSVEGACLVNSMIRAGYAVRWATPGGGYDCSASDDDGYDEGFSDNE